MTREELESIKQELKSVTPIFDFSMVFGAVFMEKHTSPRASGADLEQNNGFDRTKYTRPTPGSYSKLCYFRGVLKLQIWAIWT